MKTQKLSARGGSPARGWSASGRALGEKKLILCLALGMIIGVCAFSVAVSAYDDVTKAFGEMSYLIIGSPVVADIDPTHAGLEIAVSRSDDYLESDGGSEIYVYYSDGTLAWAGSGNGSFVGPPAVGDLDGDGSLEVVTLDMHPSVWVRDSVGSLVSPWDQNYNISSLTPYYFPAYGPPVIGDIYPNGNGREELLVVAGGKIHAWFYDGTAIPGWPKDVPSSKGIPVIADLDGNGTQEVIVGAANGNIYAWHGDISEGSLPNWPIVVPSQTFGEPDIHMFSTGLGGPAPAVADLDTNYDGLEVVMGSAEGNVYAFHSDGSPVNNWPKSTESGIYSSPVIVDLDGDPATGIEVVVSSGKKVYAWHTDGTPVEGWPQAIIEDISVYSPTVVDLDEDGTMEIFVATRAPLRTSNPTYAKVYGWFSNGNSIPPVAGWPKTVNKIYGAQGELPIEFTSNPIFTDINQDGAIEIVAATAAFPPGAGAYPISEIYVWSVMIAGPISGHVRRPDNTGINGVKVTITGVNQAIELMTDNRDGNPADPGYYHRNRVLEGSYTIQLSNP